jgi:hypothetical protein
MSAEDTAVGPNVFSVAIVWLRAHFLASSVRFEPASRP